ncbi:MAG: redoxin domain-containing protein [Planctomycetota bacterium]
MRRTPLLFRARLACALLLGSALLASGDRDAVAAGRDLTGRTAPELVFPDGANGIGPGTRLTSFRGKVVWVKFALRDCPLCRKTLPRAQDRHERWGGSGLVVLVVMHQYRPEGFRRLMQENGYTFRVGCDLDGSLARRYGVRHRPADYVIGVDGRVLSSNGAPDAVLLEALGHYRLRRLGPVVPSLEGVRRAIWRWDYGAALRVVETAARSADAPASVKRTATHVEALAREELDARLAYAAVLAARGDRASAQAVCRRVVAHFRGTALAPADGSGCRRWAGKEAGRGAGRR